MSLKNTPPSMFLSVLIIELVFCVLANSVLVLFFWVSCVLSFWMSDLIDVMSVSPNCDLLDSCFH